MSEKLLSPINRFPFRSFVFGLTALFGPFMSGCFSPFGDEPVKVTVEIFGSGPGGGRVVGSVEILGINCTMENGRWTDVKLGCLGPKFTDADGRGEFEIVGYPDPSYEAVWTCPGIYSAKVDCTVSENRIKVSYNYGPGEHNITASVKFLETFGTLRVITSTTGMKFNPSGYSVTIDGESKGAIGTDESLDFDGLRAISHAVELIIDENRPCAVVGESTQTVAISANETRAVTFEVFCEFKSGSIQVTTETVGGGDDPDGFTILVDSEAKGGIGNKDTVTVGGLVPGDRWVELADVSANCSVTPPNGRTVTVDPDATAQTAFVINCVPVVDPTVIEITTVTTGGDLDSNGYVWTVEKQPQYFNGPLEVNDTVSVTVSGGGDYEVKLLDVDLNCELDTSTLPYPRILTVAVGDTAHTTFSVTCESFGSLIVSNVTTGWDFDPDGYTVDVNGSGTGMLLPNETRTFTHFLAGNYNIKLRNTSRNCVVQANNTQNVDVEWGLPTSVAFEVECSGIVFQSNRDGFWELYAMNSDGTGTRRILSSVHTDENPAWSPDRAHVVFASDRDGDREIYVLTLADSSLVKVTDNTWDDDDPVWSPDGDSILYASSPQGGEDDLFVVSADGLGAPRPITATNSADEDDADWSPVDPLGGTARWIVYSSDQDVDGDDEIYKLDLSQNPLGAPIQLTFNTVKDDDPVWSPDGTKIAFSRRTNGDNRDIFVMNGDGTGVVQLTTFLGDDTDPSWSPDGTMLAFVSDRDGNYEIYVMLSDGGGKSRITAHAAADGEPGWRR